VNGAGEADGILAWGSSDQVEGHMLDGSEVGGSVIGSDAAFVVAEIHVHDPVKAVLDHPIGSDRRPAGPSWPAIHSNEVI
jgi:hypothetical protein